MYNALLRLDDDPVLTQLLLHKDDFLLASHDKIAARVDRALVQACELLFGPTGQKTFRGAEHDGQAADADVAALDFLAALAILDVDHDGCGVRHVAQAAFVWRHGGGMVREVFFL